MDLILDRGTVARPNAFDLPRIHRRPMDVRSNDIVGLASGVSDMAADLRRYDVGGQNREGHRFIVAGLLLQPIPGDRAAVQARRCPGLEPAKRELAVSELRRKPDRRRLADSPGRDFFFTDMNETVKERTSREHNRFRLDRAFARRHSDNRSSVKNESFDTGLNDFEIGLGTDRRLHR